MTAWWAVLRHSARRDAWRAVLLALFVAATGGVVMSAFVGARRDATVIHRMSAHINMATLALLPNVPGFDWRPIASLPEVSSLQQFAVTYFEVVDHPALNPNFPRVGPATGATVEGVVVVVGHRVDQSRADEVTIGDAAARREHLGVGDQLQLRLLNGDGLRSVISGGSPSPGETFDVAVHVVGITRGAVFAGDLQTTEAFAARFANDLVPPGFGYVNALVRLRDGSAAIDGFSQSVDRISGRPIEVMNIDDLVRGVRRATELETAALMAFAVTAAIVVILLGGIWISRSTAAAADSLPLLRALGFTRRNSVGFAAAIPAVSVVLGALGATVIAVGLSSRYPIGLGRELEPAPGRQIDVAGLVIGAGAIVAFGVLAAVVSATRAEQRAGSAVASPSRRWSIAPPLAFTLGARLATAGRRDGGSRAATVALGFGVVAVVAALTFGAGLDRAAADGTMSGQAFDSLAINVGAADLPTELVAAWRADGRVAAAVHISDIVADVDGRPVGLLAVDDLKAGAPDRALRGRLPTGAGEVALAPGEMQRLDTAIGQQLRLADGTMLRVVGEMFTPELGHTNYNAGGRVSAEQMSMLVAAGLPVKFDALLVRTSRHLSADELDDVWAGMAHEDSGLVDAQRNLGRTEQLPRVLAWFAGALAAVTAAVVLVVTTRRRRREVAVLQVFGLTGRQARAIVAWQTLTSVAVAAALGVPVGFAVGRTVWQSVVEGIPLRYSTPAAWGPVGLVVLGVGVLAVVLASRSMAITATGEPAFSLRAE